MCEYCEGTGVELDVVALVDGDADMVEAVQILIHGKPVIYGDNGSRQLEKGERVNRPAPKVLDADGVEIRVGEMVYHIETGDEFTVIAVDAESGDVHVRWGYDFEDKTGTIGGSYLTHRVPVLAADGKPLREGEKAYELESGDELAIVEVVNKNIVKCKIPGELGIWSRLRTAMSLTHERPDSWERLEADAGKNPFDYCKDVGHRLDTFENSEAYKARDLVRRCRALAERERGE